MGFFDKVKNMFIEEVEDDEIKKEVIQVKIPTPTPKEKKVEHEYEPNPKYDDEYVKPTLEEVKHKKEELNEEESELKETKTNLPKFFDDEDFLMPNERVTKEVEPEREVKLYNGSNNKVNINSNNNSRINNSFTYGSKKEEKKTFTPTPIISPVYGILDKNYKKEEISSKKPTTIYSKFDKIDVDDIRRKAYGTLEDDLENNLSSRDAIVFNDDIDSKTFGDSEITDYEEQPLDIFKELDKKDALDDILSNYEIKDNEVVNKDTDKKVKEELKHDLEDIKEDYEDKDIDESLSRNYDNYDEDSDLFNLIDSMYEDEEEEE